MTKIFFFNTQGDILQVSEQIFKVLGVRKSEILEGNSSHVLDETYYQFSVFGIKVKLEYNSYDYDDKYRYMLAIKEDILSEIEFDENIGYDVANIVARLLSRFLKDELMYEDNNGELKTYNKSDYKVFW